jgi:hypothetical protein
VLKEHQDRFFRVDHVRDFAAHTQAWIADLEHSDVRLEQPLKISVVNKVGSNSPRSDFWLFLVV